ncbi:hypothetical protein [Pontibacter sp. G13]|uniref:hypothetical protein n=1 Tax=Pontibacter sp. G13 TaxID=3074898 RepID=UPI00288AB413|nr:hypothetical protein [Pontibacter sp. G13]WNJ19047.1 hypothetical protein RJD25_01030 [Pontibacter sp. G13]
MGIRLSCLLASLMIFPVRGFSTAQILDRLIYKGDTMSIYALPLEDYLAAKGDRRINGMELGATSTACYRGYRATWEIVSGRLFLIKLRLGCVLGPDEFLDLEAEFGTAKVDASWYSGTLLAPRGKLLLYEDDPYASLFEEEWEFTIKTGRVKRLKIYHNSGPEDSTKARQENLNRTERHLYQQFDWAKIPDLGDRVIRLWIRFDLRASGKPYNIEISGRRITAKMRKHLKQITRSMPPWEVYLRRGKPLEKRNSLVLELSEAQRAKYAKPDDSR